MPKTLDEILKDIEGLAAYGEFIRNPVSTNGFMPFVSKNPRQILGEDVHDNLSPKQAREFAWLYDVARKAGIPDVNEELEVSMLTFKKNRVPKAMYIRVDVTLDFFDGHADNIWLYYPASSIISNVEDYVREYVKPLASRFANILNGTFDFTEVRKLYITVSQYDRASSIQ